MALVAKPNHETGELEFVIAEEDQLDSHSDEFCGQLVASGSCRAGVCKA
jgi:hypothetical protein